MVQWSAAIDSDDQEVLDIVVLGGHGSTELRRRTTGRLHGAEGTSGIGRGTAQGPLSQPLGETSHRNDSMGIPLPTQTRHLPVVCAWNKGGHKSMCSECRGLHCAWVSRGQWWPNGPESARRSLRPWQVGYHLTVEEPLQVMSRLVVGAHPTQTPKYSQTHRSRLGGFQPPGAPGHQSPKETSGGCEQWDSHSTLTHKTALPHPQLICPPGFHRLGACLRTIQPRA